MAMPTTPSAALLCTLLATAGLPTTNAKAQDAPTQPPERLPKPDVDPRYQPTPPERIRPVVPQLEALDIPRPGGKTAAEGSFLIRRLGVMHLIETGDLIFAPAVEPGEQKSPVFLISPSNQSDRLRAQIDGSYRWTGRVSGEVFVYKGRNLLVVSAFAPEALDQPMQAAQPVETQPVSPTPVDADGPGDPDPTTPTQPKPAEPDTTDPASVLDPRVTALTEQLLSENRSPRALDPAMNDPRLDAQEQAATPVVTGTQIIRRRARMVRDLGGRWQIRFDQDGDNHEPPLTVVPCQLLELMERQASSRGDSWTFHISGRVVASHQGGYIIPTLFISEQPSDVLPRQ